MTEEPLHVVGMPFRDGLPQLGKHDFRDAALRSVSTNPRQLSEERAIELLSEGFRQGFVSFGLKEAISSDGTVDGYVVAARDLPHFMAHAFRALCRHASITEKP